MDERQSGVWLVQNLRLSVFVPESTTIEDADWKILTGVDRPENSIGQPNFKHLWGPALGGRLQISSQPQRIDVVLVPLPPSPPAADVPPEDVVVAPSIGDFFIVLGEFYKATDAWLRAMNYDKTRIAFGSVMFRQTETIEAAGPILLGMLKSVNVDPARTSDLAFSINWLTPSNASKDLKLNRLTKFSAISYQNHRLRMEGGAAPLMITEATAAATATHGILFEIDLSTPAGRTAPLAKDEIIAIYDELIGWGIENARVGEVVCR
jgi:hypothetical protein